MTQLTRRRFSEVTALQQGTAGVFDVDIDPNWGIMGKPNGGYLIALLGRAATEAGSHPHVMAASAHFLRAPDRGPAAITTEALRTGRSASQIRATISQDGQACVEALFTTGTLTDAEPLWQAGLPPVVERSWDECRPLTPRLPNGTPVDLQEQIEVRLEPESEAFTRGEPSGRGELRGWLSLPGEAVFDPVALLFAVDAYPPATLDIGSSGWVPTFELTAYVRALPAPGPVRVVQRAQVIQGDRVDEACFIWDRDGRLVAQATQLAGVRFS